jgi:hypothetical protein
MGRYRDLTDAEIKELNALIEPSRNRRSAFFKRGEEEEQSSSKGMIRDLKKRGLLIG